MFVIPITTHGWNRRIWSFSCGITVIHPSIFVSALPSQSKYCKPHVIVWRSLCGSSVYNICVKPYVPLWMWDNLASCASLSHDIMGKVLHPVWKWKDLIYELLWWSIQMWYHWVKEMVTCQDTFFKSEKDNVCFSQEFWPFHLADHKITRNTR